MCTLAIVEVFSRVQGVAGLRVVSCSIMTNIVSGDANVSAIMIGVKAGKMTPEDNLA